MSSRLKLENLIFYRAAYLDTLVEANNGFLVTRCPDPLLRAYILLYNQFFALENRRELASEQESVWNLEFRGNGFFASPCFSADYPTQLFYEIYFNCLSVLKNNLTKK